MIEERVHGKGIKRLKKDGKKVKLSLLQAVKAYRLVRRQGSHIF
jgi:hypothetical protein